MGQADHDASKASVISALPFEGTKAGEEFGSLFCGVLYSFYVLSSLSPCVWLRDVCFQELRVELSIQVENRQGDRQLLADDVHTG